MRTDPVCGMEVKEDSASSTVYQGETYYFCCDSCKTEFASDPEKYLNKADHTAHSHGGGHHHHH